MLFLRDSGFDSSRKWELILIGAWPSEGSPSSLSMEDSPEVETPKDLLAIVVKERNRTWPGTDGRDREKLEGRWKTGTGAKKTLPDGWKSRQKKKTQPWGKNAVYIEEDNGSDLFLEPRKLLPIEPRIPTPMNRSNLMEEADAMKSKGWEEKQVSVSIRESSMDNSSGLSLELERHLWPCHVC